MEEKCAKKRKGQPYSAIPRQPLPRKTEESVSSLYHLVIAIGFGIFLCISMCVLDYVSQDTTPATDTTEIIDYFG
jgi:hypothetical protein